ACHPSGPDQHAAPRAFPLGRGRRRRDPGVRGAHHRAHQSAAQVASRRACLGRAGALMEARTGKGQARLIALVGACAAAIMTPLVAGWEGKRNDPYEDIVAVQTVCYGATRVPMRRYSDAECDEMLADALGDFAAAVLARNPELRQRPHLLAAATSLAYNIGEAGYRRSSAARRFSQGRWREGCDAILLWNRAGGKVVRGLVNRRRAERAICLQGLP